MSVKPAAKAEQAAATRRRLLDASRRLFTAKGFAHTSTEELVREAGVTRGALYHHFRDKADLFAAVFEEVEEGVTRDAMAAANDAGPPGTWEHLLAGANAFLDACLDPTVHRIVLLDAPSALGWERWRELEARYGLGLVRRALAVSMGAGMIPRGPIEPLAHMLLGGLNELALAMARADHPVSARRDAGESLERMLRGLAAT